MEASLPFAWQGGEPTLMGLDFYKHVVSLQKIHKKPNANITNAFQTNGILLDDNWATFFKQNGFLVGVSLDGPEDIHDKYRISGSGQGSYANVIGGIGSLRRCGAEFNTLTLISQANVNHPVEVYRFIRDKVNCSYHQYIDCVEFDDSGKLTDFSISGRQWGDFLCTIFDEWAGNDVNRVSVRLFDSIMSVILNKKSTLCTSCQDCRNYLLVEYNGDVYPCDFYVEEKMKLGNIMEHDWADLMSSERYVAFGKRKNHWAHDCDSCQYLDFCAGDCQKNRFTRSDVSSSKSVLCEGWKQFYDYAMPTFKKLAKKLKNRQIRAHHLMSSGGSIGRNDLCFCGSGKKFKKCCIAR